MVYYETKVMHIIKYKFNLFFAKEFLEWSSYKRFILKYVNDNCTMLQIIAVENTTDGKPISIK
jgi:hypothetical protein